MLKLPSPFGGRVGEGGFYTHFIGINIKPTIANYKNTYLFKP
jgi:hypothetical protein